MGEQKEVVIKCRYCNEVIPKMSPTWKVPICLKCRRHILDRYVYLHRAMKEDNHV